MTELLPCPFCGGEAETLTAESMYGGSLFGIMCNECRSRGDVYDTEAEAIAAWNSRAERTCHETMIDKFFHGCDSCGYMWQFFYSIGKRERPNYCPNCGAKVLRNTLKYSETDAGVVGE